MLNVEFVIMDSIPCERFHASISRIPNIGEAVNLAFEENIEKYFEVADVITAIPCDADGTQKFDAAYIVKLKEKEENKQMFERTEELDIGLKNLENIAAYVSKKH